MLLVTEGESTADNAKLQIWEGPIGSKDAWWYLEAVDGDLQSAHLGVAPRPGCDH